MSYGVAILQGKNEIVGLGGVPYWAYLLYWKKNTYLTMLVIYYNYLLREESIIDATRKRLADPVDPVVQVQDIAAEVEETPR